VDYRALDTLGEIFVLALAALGVYAMIKFRPDTQPGANHYAGTLILPPKQLAEKDILHSLNESEPEPEPSDSPEPDDPTAANREGH
jgi:multicomponent Na+:H+ antiporter subunit A